LTDKFQDVQGVKGAYLLSLPTAFYDHRGSYHETWNKKWFGRVQRQLGIKVPPFVEDDISTSRLSVFRGIHGDRKTWKLISCLYGGFELVVYDLTTGEYAWIPMFPGGASVLISPNVGNGHLVTTDTAVFHYKQTTYYGTHEQFTIPWATVDPLPISGGIIVSERDKLK
jgi:dTDP-4-dehydrorhamnose 3,5-epimerase